MQCGGHVDGKVGTAGSNQFSHWSGMLQMAGCMSQGRTLVIMCWMGKETGMEGGVVSEWKMESSGRAVLEGGLRNGVVGAAAGLASEDPGSVELLGGGPSQGQGE